jgi:hypothetical protein
LRAFCRALGRQSINLSPYLNFYHRLGPTLLLCTLEHPSHFTTPSPPLALTNVWIKTTQTCHAVAWHGLIVPSSHLAISSMPHRVKRLPLTSLDELMPALDRDQAHTRQNASAQTRPGLAHAAPERAWHSLWTRQSVTSPRVIASPQPSRSPPVDASPHRDTPGHARWPAGTPQTT